MSRSVLASSSAVLVMHAMFLAPSVVAVPCLRPASASERDGQCIPGLQSKRNINVRSKVRGQSSTNVSGDRVAVSYELIVASHSLAMPTIVKAAAPMCAAPFDRNGKRKGGKHLRATIASPQCNLAECALPPLIGHETDWSHEPTRAEYALPQLWLPSHEPNRNSSCARYALALAQAEYALHPQLWLPICLDLSPT